MLCRPELWDCSSWSESARHQDTFTDGASHTFHNTSRVLFVFFFLLFFFLSFFSHISFAKSIENENLPIWICMIASVGPSRSISSVESVRSKFSINRTSTVCVICRGSIGLSVQFLDLQLPIEMLVGTSVIKKKNNAIQKPLVVLRNSVVRVTARL